MQPGCRTAWLQAAVVKPRPIRVLLAIALGLGLLAGGIWVLALILGEHEVLYRGKSFYFWCQQVNSRTPSASNEANLMLNQEIIPQLTKTMLEDTNDSRWRLALVDGLNQLPGIQIFFQPAEGRRANAAAKFGDLGPAAAAAAPVLLRALQGHDVPVRGPAAVSLGRLHALPETVIPLLIKSLDEENLREDAAAALGEYGSQASAAIPKLLTLFPVQDKDLHHAVVEAFRRIDPTGATEARAKSAATK